MLFGITMRQIMEKLRSKTGNPFNYFRNSNHMLLIFHFLVVLVHIFCSNTKTIKIPSKVGANATDVSMGLKKFPKNQEKQTRTKDTIINMPQYHNKFILYLEVKIITQRCLLVPLGLQQLNTSHQKV